MRALIKSMHPFINFTNSVRIAKLSLVNLNFFKIISLKYNYKYIIAFLMIISIKRMIYLWKFVRISKGLYFSFRTVLFQMRINKLFVVSVKWFTFHLIIFDKYSTMKLLELFETTQQVKIRLCPYTTWKSAHRFGAFYFIILIHCTPIFVKKQIIS